MSGRYVCEVRNSSTFSFCRNSHHEFQFSFINFRPLVSPHSRRTQIVAMHKKMKFFIKNFFSKRDQIRSFLRIWSNLLTKSLMENFIFCAALQYLFHEHVGLKQLLKTSYNFQILSERCCGRGEKEPHEHRRWGG